jgi:hypothetical protein
MVLSLLAMEFVPLLLLEDTVEDIQLPQVVPMVLVVHLLVDMAEDIQLPHQVPMVLVFHLHLLDM